MKITEVINEIKKNPNNVITNVDEINLRKIIDYLSDKYYNENISLLGDEVFDYIKDYYEKKFNKKIKIGAPIINISKVRLPYFMGSLDKIKPSTNALEKWLSKYEGPFVLSEKLDGISALLYKNNNKVSLYTRGDGNEGQDITHILKHININTEKLINGDAIRGELIISKNNFKSIKEQTTNARNTVSGFVNTKKPNPKMLKLVDFVPYWVLNPSLKQIDQMKYIESKKFPNKHVEYTIKEKITNEELSTMLLKSRKNALYEIDGIVVIDSSKHYPIIPDTNPEFGFAFKQVLDDQKAETTVIDVIWEISKDKYIKPKIQIVPVEISGVEINFATANNAKFVVDNKIGLGSKIEIIRSGDVIPKIEKILSSSTSGKPKMPSIEYEWNETKVDIIAINLVDDDNDKLIIKKLAFFFSTLNIKYMGEGTITKFVINGYNDLWKILLADKEKIKLINGLGSKSVENIYASIDEGLQNVDLAKIMSASLIFGRGVGTKKFKSITDVYPNIIDIYKKKGKSEINKLINSISGFDTKTTNKIVNYMDDFIEFYNKLIKIKPEIIKPEINNNTENKSNKNKKSLLYPNINNFTDKKIVMTGFRDKELAQELENFGVKISETVSKNTDLVIAKNINDNSEKIKKAQNLNIQIISKDDFIKLIS
jgi:NAD-dependent DNA ligase